MDIPLTRSDKDSANDKRLYLMIAAWMVFSWMSADFYFSHYATKLYQQESQLAEVQVQQVASNIDESLRQLKGIPIVFVRDEDTLKTLRYFNTISASGSLPYQERKTLWSDDKVLARYGETLDIAADNLVADVIWVLNRDGDCIAASNAGRQESFVGTNYADREYFRQAKLGRPGRQYAVGRASAVPGLFFSAPIFDNGIFVGAVVVKRNISNFAQWTNQADAFLSDSNGVIVLAPNSSLQFRAMPDAPALKLPADAVLAQYKTHTLTPLQISPWGDDRFPSAVRIEDHARPILLASKAMLEDAITIHVRRPLEELIRLSHERLWFFILMAGLGGMLIYAAAVVFFYLRKLQKTESALRVSATAFEARESMIITNAGGLILKVNRAFVENTGYLNEEAVGQTPCLINSDRNSDEVLVAIGESLLETGTWSGEIWTRRKSGEEHPNWLTVTAVKGAKGEVTHYVGTLMDISQRKAAEQEIQQLAFYDPLTTLPNRRLLMDRLQHALSSVRRNGLQGALFFIDLDNFKSLNDTRGHDQGDLLLQQVAERLVSCVRETDTVARLGGDEFVVMLENLSEDRHEAMAAAEVLGAKILKSLSENYLLAGHEHHSTPSIGVTLFGELYGSVEELLKQADLAMYEAKTSGRNALRFFDPEMQAEVATRVGLENELRHAVSTQQFQLYYQAQMNASGHVIGAEALIRWQHPERGLVPPDKFIPVAEESGLILPIGKWVLETACRQLSVWANQPGMSHLTVAVNVSALQFRHAGFVAEVLDTLEHTHANPLKLKLELTESLLLDDVEGVIEKMMLLKARGVGFSLDDFGTGYSSLSYLKRLPLDQLKIDKSFVRELVPDGSDAAICAATVGLARNLKFEVVAEGVETREQCDYLLKIGCDFIQGYLYSKPLPLSGFEAFLHQEHAIRSSAALDCVDEHMRPSDNSPEKPQRTIELYTLAPN